MVITLCVGFFRVRAGNYMWFDHVLFNQMPQCACASQDCCTISPAIYIGRLASTESRKEAGVVGREVLCYWSPACTVKHRQSSLHATLSLTLTPCKSMQGGLGFQGGSLSFRSVLTGNHIWLCLILWRCTFRQEKNLPWTIRAMIEMHLQKVTDKTWCRYMGWFFRFGYVCVDIDATWWAHRWRCQNASIKDSLLPFPLGGRITKCNSAGRHSLSP